MGRELFDYAFKMYCERWALKHPTPADFFRTMEDASAVDLDWFWRGWFFGIDPVDISLDSVKWYKMDVPENQAALKKPAFEHFGIARNAADKSIQFAVDTDTSLRDFYYYNRSADDDEAMFRRMMRGRAQEEGEPASDSIRKICASRNFFELSFSNVGGLVMPIIVEFTFKDGSTKVERIPAEIWRKNEQKVKKTFMVEKEVASIRLDPFKETADINEANGMWPIKELPSKFQIFKGGRAARGASSMGSNPMQKAREKAAEKK
jgi:hypothetical protein